MIQQISSVQEHARMTFSCLVMAIPTALPTKPIKVNSVTDPDYTAQQHYTATVARSQNLVPVLTPSIRIPVRTFTPEIPGCLPSLCPANFP